MEDQSNPVRIYHFPRRKFSDEELTYGLWIGMAYSTITPNMNGFVKMRPRKFKFYSISHLYSGRGKIQLKDEPEIDLQAGDCIVIPPDVVNRYGSYGDYQFMEDSIKFSGPIADMMFKSGIIKTGIYHIGTTRVLREIIDLVNFPSIKKRLQANLFLQNFLMELYLASDASENPRPSIEVLLKMIQDSPDEKWNLSKLTGLCQISANQLRKKFLKHTGMLPKEYIDTQKIRFAEELLRTTELPICDIARRFGWRDPYHFSRRFKQLMGLSPVHYRMKLKNEKSDSTGKR